MVKLNKEGIIMKDKEIADPWANRSERMKCTNCMWFVLKVGSRLSVGRCRKHAPTMSGYPVTFTTDWCGDHKLSEYIL